MKTLVLYTPALHLGYLGCYGNEWVATPNMDRLAAEGVVFDQHYATCPDEELNLDVLANSLGIAKGIERVDLPSLEPPWNIPEDYQQLYLDDGEPWLDPPIGPLEGDLDVLQNTYAAVITHLDYQVGQLREKWKDQWDDLTVVLTASSGLALGEHGVVGPHRAWMHEEVWHIPLIVRLPKGDEAGRRVRTLTQPGDALMPLIRGEQEQVREFAFGRLRIGDSLEWALRSLDWAFLLPIAVPAGDPPREAQLYVKPDDRWEVNNVRHHNQELAEELEERLRNLQSAAP